MAVDTALGSILECLLFLLRSLAQLREEQLYPHLRGVPPRLSIFFLGWETLCRRHGHIVKPEKISLHQVLRQLCFCSSTLCTLFRGGTLLSVRPLSSQIVPGNCPTVVCLVETNHHRKLQRTDSLWTEACFQMVQVFFSSIRTSVSISQSNTPSAAKRRLSSTAAPLYRSPLPCPTPVITCRL